MADEERTERGLLPPTDPVDVAEVAIQFVDDYCSRLLLWLPGAMRQIPAPIRDDPFELVSYKYGLVKDLLARAPWLIEAGDE